MGPYDYERLGLNQLDREDEDWCEECNCPAAICPCNEPPERDDSDY